MDALGVCYPQYWLHHDDEKKKIQHFMLIKNHYYYEAKLQANFVVFPSILSLEAMNLQQNIFKCTMKANVFIAMEPPFHVNLFNRLQRTLSISQVLKNSFLKFFKLAKIAAIQILGSVEDEHTFSTFSFMESSCEIVVWTFCNYYGHVFPTFLHTRKLSIWCHIWRMEEGKGSPIVILMVSNLMKCNFEVDNYLVMNVFRCKTFFQFCLLIPMDYRYVVV